MQIKIKVKTKAKEEKVVEVGEDSFEVWVKALPEKGKANEAIIKILAKHFKVPQNSVKIVAGKTSKQKAVLIKQ